MTQASLQENENDGIIYHPLNSRDERGVKSILSPKSLVNRNLSDPSRDHHNWEQISSTGVSREIDSCRSTPTWSLELCGQEEVLALIRVTYQVAGDRLKRMTAACR